MTIKYTPKAYHIEISEVNYNEYFAEVMGQEVETGKPFYAMTKDSHRIEAIEREMNAARVVTSGYVTTAVSKRNKKEFLFSIALFH